MKWKIPEEMTVEQIIEIRDGLISGKISVQLTDDTDISDEIMKWQRLVIEQLTEAYNARLKILIQ